MAANRRPTPDDEPAVAELDALRARVTELEAETSARNEELALINEIGAGLAQQLDFQAIVDLVGDRLDTLFSPQGMLHRHLQRGNGQDRFSL